MKPSTDDAELLAAEWIALRQHAFTARGPFRPLPPAMQRGYYLAALARGWGRPGVYEPSRMDGVTGCYLLGGIHMPKTPEVLAGWLVWHAEMLDHGGAS
jgi:hypothetical protein